MILVWIACLVASLAGSQDGETNCGPTKCSIRCDSGFRLDQDGCETCGCVDPCEKRVCSRGKTCKQRKILCRQEPCYNESYCEECPPRDCKEPCESGYRLKSNCEMCDCVDPCEYSSCPPGQVCTSYNTVCESSPCYPELKCVPGCTSLACPFECVSGYRMDERNCPLCRCEDPCEHLSCSPGEECVVRNSTCSKCHSVGECVPVACPSLNCPHKCASDYRMDTKGCKTCECVDPCEYSDCQHYEICKPIQPACSQSRCYPIAKCDSICKGIKCMNECKSGYRANSKGCKTCICINPCESNDLCETGQTCKMKMTSCLNPPCYPSYVCE